MKAVNRLQQVLHLFSGGLLRCLEALRRLDRFLSSAIWKRKRISGGAFHQVGSLRTTTLSLLSDCYLHTTFLVLCRMQHYYHRLSSNSCQVTLFDFWHYAVVHPHRLYSDYFSMTLLDFCRTGHHALMQPHRLSIDYFSMTTLDFCRIVH